jgi:hypothetical protein
MHPFFESSPNYHQDRGSTLDPPEAPHFLHPRGLQRVDCEKTAEKSRYSRLTDELGLSVEKNGWRK